jgi:hypothetical protein
MQSDIKATGKQQANTGTFGIVMSDDGATPKLHLHIAPQTATLGTRDFEPH